MKNSTSYCIAALIIFLLALFFWFQNSEKDKVSNYSQSYKEYLLEKEPYLYNQMYGKETARALSKDN